MGRVQNKEKLKFKKVCLLGFKNVCVSNFFAYKLRKDLKHFGGPNALS